LRVKEVEPRKSEYLRIYEITFRNNIMERKNRYFLWFLFFFLFMGTGAVQPYISVYLKENLHFSYLKFSSVLAAVYISMAFMRVLTSRILSGSGLKKGIVLGALSYCFFAFVFVFSKKYFLFLPSAVIWGAGAAVLWIASLTLLLKITDRERFGVENGYLRLFVQMGLILGFFILGQVLYSKGYQYLFGLACLFSFLGFCSAFFLTEKRSKINTPSFSAIFSGDLFIFAVALLIGAMGYGLVLNLLNHFVAETFGREFLNRIIIFFYLSAGLLSVAGGKFIDKTGEHPACILFFALAGGILLLFSRVSNVFLCIIAMIFFGGLFQVVPIASTVRVGKLVAEEDRSGGLGAMFFWRDIGIGSSIFFLGYLKSRLNYSCIFVIVGLIFIVMSAVFLLDYSGRRTGKTQ
jgi:predicted MFS family arabinose efflux permease